MPILNYTTTISAAKTVGEIQDKLAKAGASAMMIDYENGEPNAVSFLLSVNGQIISFRLPSRWEGVLKALKGSRKVPRSKCTEEQARRVAWRIVKDWTEAQLAIVEAEVASMAEVFLPYAVGQDGRTLYQTLADNPSRLLGARSDGE